MGDFSYTKVGGVGVGGNKKGRSSQVFLWGGNETQIFSALYKGTPKDEDEQEGDNNYDYEDISTAGGY